MRLINANTLRLESFFGRLIPPYAILSHTWEDEEVTFEDMAQQDVAATKKGYQKIRATCQRALAKGLEYAWVDTCCIDKRSSAELSEAINSMFEWYRKSEVCLVYLSDLAYNEDQSDGKRVARSSISFLPQSRWFTRCWTLQELLAPRHVVFFSENWVKLDPSSDLLEAITKATRIDERYLRSSVFGLTTIPKSPLTEASIAERMSWAAGRQATRNEDVAYSLLGLFGVNMPLLYGEGKHAFVRLQEEIMRISPDQSLFAWDPQYPRKFIISTSLFAESPENFRGSYNIIPDEFSVSKEPFSLTNRGVQLRVPVGIVTASGRRRCVIVLACRRRDMLMQAVTLPVSHIQGIDYERKPDSFDLVFRDHVAELQIHKIYVQTNLEARRLPDIGSTGSWTPKVFLIRQVFPGITIAKVEPRDGWDHLNRVIRHGNQWDNIPKTLSRLDYFEPFTVDDRSYAAAIDIRVKGEHGHEMRLDILLAVSNYEQCVYMLAPSGVSSSSRHEASNVYTDFLQTSSFLKEERDRTSRRFSPSWYTSLANLKPGNLMEDRLGDVRVQLSPPQEIQWNGEVQSVIAVDILHV